jgi:hypothetical protein
VLDVVQRALLVSGHLEQQQKQPPPSTLLDLLPPQTVDQCKELAVIMTGTSDKPAFSYIHTLYTYIQYNIYRYAEAEPGGWRLTSLHASIEASGGALPPFPVHCTANHSQSQLQSSLPLFHACVCVCIGPRTCYALLPVQNIPPSLTVYRFHRDGPSQDWKPMPKAEAEGAQVQGTEYHATYI